jgi:hypothetical protein
MKRAESTVGVERQNNGADSQVTARRNNHMPAWHPADRQLAQSRTILPGAHNGAREMSTNLIVALLAIVITLVVVATAHELITHSDGAAEVVVR